MGCRTAILISGGGSNLQAFIDAAAAGSIGLDLCVVGSNNPTAYGLTRAAEAGIDAFCLPHTDFEDRASFERSLIDKLQHWRPELLVLAGFMRILSPVLVRQYRGRILNIHPALLPKYPGLDTHQRVLDAGDQWHGSTVHFVTEELDAGPRILQGRLQVGACDSASELMRRVQAVEHRIYPRAADWVGSGRVRFENGKALIDGKDADEPIVETFD